MIDVLLAHSYFLKYDPKQLQKMRPYPPLATLYAASLLRSRGYNVALFDAMLSDGEHEFADIAVIEFVALVGIEILVRKADPGRFVFLVVLRQVRIRHEMHDVETKRRGHRGSPWRFPWDARRFAGDAVWVLVCRQGGQTAAAIRIVTHFPSQSF